MAVARHPLARVAPPAPAIISASRAREWRAIKVNEGNCWSRFGATMELRRWTDAADGGIADRGGGRGSYRVIDFNARQILQRAHRLSRFDISGWRARGLYPLVQGSRDARGRIDREHDPRRRPFRFRKNRRCSTGASR